MKYVLLLVLLFLIGCQVDAPVIEETEVVEPTDSEEVIEMGDEMDETDILPEVEEETEEVVDLVKKNILGLDFKTGKPDWFTIPLTNVMNGKTYTVDDFKGEPVLFETFAVWCPTCKKQQDNTHEAKELIDFKAVTIDIDPNEDADLVRDYIRKHNFEGAYAISPVEFTKSLVDEFGTGIVSAPSAPMIVICEDQRYAFLKRGLKSPEYLVDAINSC